MKELDATIQGLFQRCPQLAGFSVQDVQSLSRDRAAGRLEGNLFLADLGVYPGAARTDALLGEIAVTLLDLIDQKPEARELIRGRTFARTLH